MLDLPLRVTLLFAGFLFSGMDNVLHGSSPLCHLRDFSQYFCQFKLNTGLPDPE